jgi:DNA (cytosine-5)-methyltransferase 1
MNVLSLFAGIGGLDLGLERAGMSVVGQVEIDPYCQRVLAKHWPEVPRHDDVRTAVAWWLGRTRPAVDVVAGGFPCQPVSTAGRRLAQADERWLWPAAWAVIRDLRPRYAIMENVPGLLARGMGDVLADLAEIGYDAEWDCIPAATVGAPHRRDRVFVVAYPRRRIVWLQPEPVAGRGGPSVAGHNGANGHVADAIGDGLKRLTEFSTRREPIRHRLRANPDGCDSGLADASGKGSPRRSSEPGGRPGETRRLEPERLGHVFAGHRPVAGGHWASEPDVGRVAHGIPARVDRLRALGNAVVPQVAEHIGRLVMAYDRDG